MALLALWGRRSLGLAAVFGIAWACFVTFSWLATSTNHSLSAILLLHIEGANFLSRNGIVASLDHRRAATRNSGGGLAINWSTCQSALSLASCPSASVAPSSLARSYQLRALA
jgi:hypothetical protein